MKPGVEAGEVPEDVESRLAALSLVGAIVCKCLMTSELFQPERVRDLVDPVLGTPDTV